MQNIPLWCVFSALQHIVANIERSYLKKKNLQIFQIIHLEYIS